MITEQKKWKVSGKSPLVENNTKTAPDGSLRGLQTERHMKLALRPGFGRNAPNYAALASMMNYHFSPESRHWIPIKTPRADALESVPLEKRLYKIPRHGS